MEEKQIKDIHIFLHAVYNHLMCHYYLFFCIAGEAILWCTVGQDLITLIWVSCERSFPPKEFEYR